MTAKEKLELVDRVVNSPIFSRSPAMRAFLLYITKHAIAERSERIKEQSIGSEVLGRRPNYDPAEDNIVRVRAHELRQRLEKYFATDGIDEPFIITVPKGSYIPEFHARAAADSLVAPAPIAEPATPAVEVKAAEPKPERRLPRWLWVTAPVLAIVAIAAIALLSRSASQAKRVIDGPVQNAAIQDFWGQFFAHPEEDLRVVTADTGFALWQDLSGKDLNLGDYLSRKYLELPDDKIREVAVRRATSPADLAISLQLAGLARDFGGRINEQYARDLVARTFQKGNIVVIGSHRSNPWIEIFEPHLNFVVERDATTGAPFFRNKSPLPTEAPTYMIPAMLDANGAEQKEIESYGVVSLLKGCNGHDLVVLLEGLNMEATEAAGEVVTNPQRLGTMLRSIGHQPGKAVAPFEALIKLTSMPGGYANSQVIAYRVGTSASCGTR
ncbi:MAG TPA: hypothetical protein VM554_14900 [Acidisarcina sp.]|nr:hypothetical protein [Acidisarcina sp.]